MNDLIFVSAHDCAETVLSLSKTKGISRVFLDCDDGNFAELDQVIRRSELAVIDKPAPRTIVVISASSSDAISAKLLSLIVALEITVVVIKNEDFIEKRPVFLVSIPKAGTHLAAGLLELFGYHFNPQFDHTLAAGSYYNLEYSNTHTVAKDFFVDTVRRSVFGNRAHPFRSAVTLLVYRHPLDILVSEANYYGKKNNTVFGGAFSEMNLHERIEFLLEDEFLLGKFFHRLASFIPWLYFPNVLPVSFEELVGEEGGGSEELQSRVVWALMLKLCVSGSVAEFKRKIFRRESATFVKGQIGAWKNILDKSLIEKCFVENKKIFESYGYDVRDTFPNREVINSRLWKAPAVMEHIQIPPIAVEFDYLGFNLVSYKQAYFAIPTEIGAVSLDQLSHDQRDIFPQHAFLSDLKHNILAQDISLGVSHGFSQYIRDRFNFIYRNKVPFFAYIGEVWQFHLYGFYGKILMLDEPIDNFNVLMNDLEKIKSCLVESMEAVNEKVLLLTLAEQTRIISDASMEAYKIMDDNKADFQEKYLELEEKIKKLNDELRGGWFYKITKKLKSIFSN